MLKNISASVFSFQFKNKKYSDIAIDCIGQYLNLYNKKTSVLTD